MKYLRHFESNTQYNEYISSSPTLPNVSYVEEGDGKVYYNPYVAPQGTPCKLTFINRDPWLTPQQVTIDATEGITWLDFVNSSANTTFVYNDSEYKTFEAYIFDDGYSYVIFNIAVTEEDWVYRYMISYDGTDVNCIKSDDIIDSSITYYIKVYD